MINISTSQHFNCVLEQVWLKQDLIWCIISFVFELSHKLLKYLRLRILGNLGMLGESQNSMVTQTSVQSLFKKQFLAIVSKNYKKANITVFRSPPILIDLVTFSHKICPGLWVEANFRARHVSFRHQYLNIFHNFKVFLKHSMQV